MDGQAATLPAVTRLWNLVALLSAASSQSANSRSNCFMLRGSNRAWPTRKGRGAGGRSNRSDRRTANDRRYNAAEAGAAPANPRQKLDFIIAHLTAAGQFNGSTE
jgi:hypothetical protein